MDQDEDEEETRRLTCSRCGHVGLDESDGFFYCQECGAQADDIILTGVADEDFIDKDGDGGGALYSARHTRRIHAPRTASQPDPSSQAWLRYTQEDEGNKINGVKIKREEVDNYNYPYSDGIGPTEPEDFGSGASGKLSYEDYYNEVRFRYVMGMQWMIQLQCEALVNVFNVSPLICGVSGTLWLRFLAGTGVFKDGWADEVLMESEVQKPGEFEERRPSGKYADEPHNALGQRAVMVWFRSMRKRIPLSYSLAISFLACHVVRAPVLPTDIVKWSIEGKLPYFAAHVDIEKRFERSSAACVISSSLMFRPLQAVPVQKLEAVAANIAESIGLHLPPVNFYEISHRYLKQLYLPVEKILPYACRIYEWSMPPDLWLSANELRLPTHVCVMSILIVAIRMLYNINGFGSWEKSFYKDNDATSSAHGNGRYDSMSVDTEHDSVSPQTDDIDEKSVRNSSKFPELVLDSVELLRNLEAWYDEMVIKYEYTKDLPSYLQYCKDVVFSGAGQSHNREEEELIEKLWDFYQNEKDCDPTEEVGKQSSPYFYQKRPRDDDAFGKKLFEKKKVKEDYHETPFNDINTPHEYISPQESLGDGSSSSHNSLEDQNLERDDDDKAEAVKSVAVRRLKSDMEENRFCYIPPRVNLKRFDYLHYVRKKDEGAFTYVAHADYYILLRACARVAQVDIRIMHTGVLSFERRLAWLEKRIEHCLHLTPPSITCEFCGNVPDDYSMEDPVGLSNLNL